MLCLQGVNLPLAYTGQEAIYQKLYNQFGLSNESLSEYFGGPAFLAWNRGQGLLAWGGKDRMEAAPPIQAVPITSSCDSQPECTNQCKQNANQPIQLLLGPTVKPNALIVQAMATIGGMRTNLGDYWPAFRSIKILPEDWTTPTPR